MPLAWARFAPAPRQGFELDIITIVLLGGVSIFGGVGSMVGVLLSILLVLNIRNGMTIAGITGNTQTGVIGLLLILSVLIPNLARARRDDSRARPSIRNFRRHARKRPRKTPGERRCPAHSWIHVGELRFRRSNRRNAK